MSREKRRHDRYPIKLAVKLVTGRGETQLYTIDVSYSGAYIHVDEPPPLRELIKMELSVPYQEEPLKLMGMAVFCLAAKDAGTRIPGVGVQLFGMDSKSQAEWDNLVRFAREVGANYEPPGLSAPTPKPVMGDSSVANQLAAESKPELRIQLVKAEDLGSLLNRDLVAGTIRLRTPVELPPGTDVLLNFVHPTTQEVFSLAAKVQQVLKDSFQGLELELAEVGLEQRKAFKDFAVDEEIYVTIDLDLNALDMPI